MSVRSPPVPVRLTEALRDYPEHIEKLQEVGQGDVTLLTTVDQLDPLYVNFSMSVDELTQMRAAQAKGQVALSGDGKSTVQVKLSDGTVYDQAGTLDFSSTTVDPATGAVSLRAVLPNPQQILLPGAFVSFQATLGERNNAYLVPLQALQRDTSGGYVLVVGKDGKVARKNVKSEGQQGSSWLVSGGLEPGDQVIVAGVQKVKEGAPAKAAPWNPNAANANGHPADRRWVCRWCRVGNPDRHARRPLLGGRDTDAHATAHMRAEAAGTHRHTHRRSAGPYAHQDHTIGAECGRFALEPHHGRVGLALRAEPHRAGRFQLRDLDRAGRRG